MFWRWSFTELCGLAEAVSITGGQTGLAGSADHFTGRITVTDGPVKGAQVWVDVDGNGEIDPEVDVLLGETNAAGQWISRPVSRPGVIVQLQDADGVPATDTATGEALSGEWKSLPSDQDGSVVVTADRSAGAPDGDARQC